MPNTTTPHPLTGTTDFGAIGETRDGGNDHTSDVAVVCGKYLNKIAADVKQLHDAEVGKRTVTAKTTGYSLVDADHGKLFTNVGASGLFEFLLPTPVAGRFFKFYDQLGLGIGIRCRTGHKIRLGSLESSDAGGLQSLAAQKSFCIVEAVSTTLWVMHPTPDAWDYL